MSVLKRLGVAFGGILLLLLVVVLGRTLVFTPPALALADPARIAPAPPIDVEVAAQHLGAAVRIRTVSHQDAGEDELPAWQALHDWLEATYPATHRALTREVVDGRTLIYTWTGSEPALAPVIVMAHQDVVPIEAATEASWRHPPFSGEVADGAVWGRGTVDDKGSLVALFEALEALTRAGYTPRRTLILVSGHNEEVLGGGAARAAALLESRGIKAEFVLDEGLLITTSLPVTHGPAALIGIAEKGYGSLTVTAHASGGHSSMPPDQTAVSTLATALVAIAAHPAPATLDGPTATMLAAIAPSAPFAFRMALANQWLFAPLIVRTLRATPTGAAMLRTTMAPTMLSGSAKENVLPVDAIATINYRIAPGDSAAAVLARTQAAVAGVPVALAWLHPPLEPSAVSSITARGFALIAALAAEAAHGPVTPALMIGGTDARSLQGVATDVYRFQPVTLAPADYDMIHGTNEHMTLANLGQAIRFYARLIRSATD